MNRTQDTDHVQASLQNKLEKQGFEVASWRELVRFFMTRHCNSPRPSVRLACAFIILLMVLLSVVNSVNMTLFERTKGVWDAARLGR